MKSHLALGIDLGTSSVKALLLDGDGHVRGEAARFYEVRAPRPGWVETDPQSWWEATVRAVRACCEVGGVQDGEIVGIGLSGQMHGVVLCGSDGGPLRPAVLWADTRSREVLPAYEKLPEAARRRLANPVTPGMAGPILVWLLRHEPDRCRQARWALQPKDWLRLQLTGETLAEPSDASATLLYDMEAGTWSDDVVAGLGLPPSWLAPIRPSMEVAGFLTARAAEALGLQQGLPVAAGGGDTACAAFGSGLARPGEVQVTIGTGMQIVAVRTGPSPDQTGRTHLFRTVDGGWYALAAMQNGGLAVEWVRSLLGLEREALYAEAFAVPPGAEGLTFLPYLTGERTPLLDADAQGSFVGLTLRHGRNHIARASLEGIAFALRDGLEALRAAGIRPERLRLAGGGSLDPRWRQLLADVLQRPLEAVPVPSASARGAAALGWLAAGGRAPMSPPPYLVAEPRPAEALEDAFQRFRHRYREERAKRPAF